MDDLSRRGYVTNSRYGLAGTGEAGMSGAEMVGWFRGEPGAAIGCAMPCGNEPGGARRSGGKPGSDAVATAGLRRAGSEGRDESECRKPDGKRCAQRGVAKGGAERGTTSGANRGEGIEGAQSGCTMSRARRFPRRREARRMAMFRPVFPSANEPGIPPAFGGDPGADAGRVGANDALPREAGRGCGIAAREFLERLFF